MTTNLCKVLNNTKRYEDLAQKRSQGYEDIERAMEFVRKFIIKKKLILYGGMAIDESLKKAGHKGIYKADAVPDYDFMSPNYYEDANELAEILHKAGFKNVQAVNAIHVSTRKVRVNFVWVADITYVPPVVFRTIPTLTATGGLRVVHPDFQRLDVHRAMSTPFEKPPMEVFLHRAKKDQQRFRMLAEKYPIKLPKIVECVQSGEMRWEVPKNLYSDGVIGGTQAYCTIWQVLDQLLHGRGRLAQMVAAAGKIDPNIERRFAALPRGGVKCEGDKIVFNLGFNCPRLHMVNLINDDFQAVLERITGDKAPKGAHYFNKYVDDWRPRTVVLPDSKSGNTYEIFDNKPRLLPSWRMADVYKLLGSDWRGGPEVRVCGPQYVLMYFLQKYFGGGFLKDGKLDRAEQKVFLKMYLAIQEIVEIAEALYIAMTVDKSDTSPVDRVFAELPFFLTARTYGNYNWSPDYIVSVREQTYFVNHVSRDKQEIMKPPRGYYLDTAQGPPPSFNPDDSEFFQFDGQERKQPFDPIVLKID